MLDFNRFTDAIAALLGQQVANTNTDIATLLRQIEQTGLDTEGLKGLPADQVAAVLVDHGVDLTALSPALLSALTDALETRGCIAVAVEPFVDDRDAA